MAGMNLGFPFDEEIFNYNWKNTPDLVLTSMLESGAVALDGEIAELIANGSNYFTVPFYDNLGGEAQSYNGVEDFINDTLTGGTYSGVVYGRMKSWDAKSFIKDFNSGADPMAQIVSGVANYWIKHRQDVLVGIIEAVLGVNDDELEPHVLDITSSTATVTEDNKVGATTINDLITGANGDNAGGYALAIMHSRVANDLANLQLLEFSKYTDISGITRNLPIAQVNGLTVIINDGVPVDKQISYAITTDVAIDATKTYYTRTGTVGKYVYKAVASPKVADIATYYEKTDLPDKYTTFVLGQGAIRFAVAPVDAPSEMGRNPAVAGGKDIIYTRVRECFAPYGFSFIGDKDTDVAVPNSVLHDSGSWERKMPAKAIMMAKLVSN